MAFVSPPLSNPHSLGHHTAFDERPSSGEGAWAEPDPLAVEHDALLRRVLIDQGITQSDLEAGDAAVAVCLDAASKAHTTLQEVTSFLSSIPQTHLSAAAIAAITVGDAGGSGSGGGAGGGAENDSQAGMSQAAAAVATTAQPNRKRPLSAGGLAAAPDVPLDASTTNNTNRLLISPSDGSGASSLATLAESSLEAAAAAEKASNKGLRHFSLKVCEKVEGKGFTNYNEVADELVQDMLADAAAGIPGDASQGTGNGGAGGASASGSGPHDDKNIRRRVYDALNVLEALGIISKSKRDIEWRGWPPALRRTTTEKDRLEAERARLAAKIKLKVEATEDVATKAFCLSNLVLRNRDAPLSALVAAQELGMMAPNPLALPFMLVHAPENAEVDIDITPDERTAKLDFHHYPFQIFDDERVMQMMGLGEPQPELAAAVFGTATGSAGGGEGDTTGRGEGGRAGTAAAAAVGDDQHLFAGLASDPEYHHHHHDQGAKLEQDTYQQQQSIDMADTPLKMGNNNNNNNNALGGGFGGAGGGNVPVMNGSMGVLSPSAAVSAMDLGPDDYTTK